MQLNNKTIVRTALCAVLVSALGYSFVAKSETKLLPFQGKLTDANGQVIEDKAIVVQFKMYDAPVGGQAKWNGEVQMLTVNGGLVNTTLGTKASLKNVDFSSPTYLEITIDANGDNQIGPEDPPLLPRQSIIPAVYAVQAGEAKNADKLNGYDWSSIFGNNDPTEKIPGDKLANKSIGTEKIADNAVTANQVANGAITSAKLAKNSVTTDKIAEKSITTGLMANRVMVDASETAAPVGSIARSKGSIGATGSNGYTVGNDAVESNPKLIPGFSLKLKTSGRPVMIMLQTGQFNIMHGDAQFHLRRNGETIFWTGIGGNSSDDLAFPCPGILTHVDTPPAGEYEYSLYVYKRPATAQLRCWSNPYLIAFEL